MAASLPLIEKLNLALRLFTTVPGTLFLNIVRIFSTAAYRRHRLRPYLFAALIRTLLGALTPRQLQFVSPPTATVYKTWISDQLKKGKLSNDLTLTSRIRHDREPLPDGSSFINWIGNRSAAKIILFLHGGGYVAPLAPGHLDWLLAVIRSGLSSRVEVAAAVLEYSLCPPRHYPTQLCQAVDALAHLLDSGYKPGNIIIGGDSAGGNLTFALLGHLLHPHPAAKAIRLQGPLAGAFGVSPWVTLDSSTRSFKENVNIDMLSPSMIWSGGNRYLEGSNWKTEVAKGQGWGMPLDAAKEWWDGMEKVTTRVYMTAGKQELFRDHVIEFAEKIKDRNIGLVDVRLEVPESEAHDFILVECMEKIENGDAMRRMTEWLLETYTRV